LFVAGLVSWRFLVGSMHEQRHERSASASARPITQAGGAEESEGAYEAVSVNICAQPCAAVRDIRGQSFLSPDAPNLPLAKCDRACTCSYKTHPDRRIGADRRYPDQDYAKVATHAAIDEQRAGRDRRRKGRFQYQGIY